MSGEPTAQPTREEFEAAAERLLARADGAGVTLRLLGALAFRHHCPRYGSLQDRLERHYTDIDFAGYGREADRIRELFRELGYHEDSAVYINSEGTRLVFESSSQGPHVDVFLDKLEFCHTIPWRHRLEADHPTIPLAELLLEKMQIVEINEKDLIDTAMLLLEHDVGETDDETINMGYVASLCAKDWGLYRTVTMNLDKVRAFGRVNSVLEGEEKRILEARTDAALRRIEDESKTGRWKLRARVGDRVKWYREVGEVAPG
jgi:hypothetical protein